MTRYIVKITEYDTDRFPSEVKRFAARVDFEGEGWPRYVDRYADTELEVMEIIRRDTPLALEERESFLANIRTLDNEISTKEIEIIL